MKNLEHFSAISTAATTLAAKLRLGRFVLRSFDSRRILCLALLSLPMLAIGGCSEALPNQDLRAVGEQTRVVASSYAAETKQNAEAAEAKLKRAEELLREARELTARAEAAEKRCAERAARVEKTKPVIINRCPQPPPPTEESHAESSSGAAPKPTSTPASGSPSSGHPVATPAAQSTATPAEHEDPSPKKDPEYSPSDAPL